MFQTGWEEVAWSEVGCDRKQQGEMYNQVVGIEGHMLVGERSPVVVVVVVVEGHILVGERSLVVVVVEGHILGEEVESYRPLKKRI